MLGQRLLGHEDDIGAAPSFFFSGRAGQKERGKEEGGPASESTMTNHTLSALRQLDRLCPQRQSSQSAFQTVRLPEVHPGLSVCESMTEGAAHVARPPRSAATAGVSPMDFQADDHSAVAAWRSTAGTLQSSPTAARNRGEPATSGLASGTRPSEGGTGKPEQTTTALRERTILCAAGEAQSPLVGQSPVGRALQEPRAPVSAARILTPRRPEECSQDYQLPDGITPEGIRKDHGLHRTEAAAFQQVRVDGEFEDRECPWSDRVRAATGRGCAVADGSRVPERQEQLGAAGKMCCSDLPSDGQPGCSPEHCNITQKPQAEQTLYVGGEAMHRMTARVQPGTVKQGALSGSADFVACEAKESPTPAVSAMQEARWIVTDPGGHQLASVSSSSGDLLPDESEKVASAATDTSAHCGSFGISAQRPVGHSARECAAKIHSADASAAQGECYCKGGPPEEESWGRPLVSSPDHYGAGGQPDESAGSTSAGYSSGLFEGPRKAMQPDIQVRDRRIAAADTSGNLDLADSSCARTNTQSILHPSGGDQERRENGKEKQHLDSAAKSLGQPGRETAALSGSAQEFAPRQETSGTSVAPEDGCQPRHRQGFNPGEREGDYKAFLQKQDECQRMAPADNLVLNNSAVDAAIPTSLTGQLRIRGGGVTGTSVPPGATYEAPPTEGFFSAVPLHASPHRSHNDKMRTVRPGISQTDSLAHLSEPKHSGNTGLASYYRNLVAPATPGSADAPLSLLPASGLLWDKPTAPGQVKADSQEDRLRKGCDVSVTETLQPLGRSSLTNAGQGSPELEPCAIERGKACRQTVQECLRTQSDNTNTDVRCDCPSLAAQTSAIFSGPTSNRLASPVAAPQAPSQETPAAVLAAIGSAIPGNDCVLPDNPEESSAIPGDTRGSSDAFHAEHRSPENTEDSVRAGSSRVPSQETFVDGDGMLATRETAADADSASAEHPEPDSGRNVPRDRQAPCAFSRAISSERSLPGGAPDGLLLAASTMGLGDVLLRPRDGLPSSLPPGLALKGEAQGRSPADAGLLRSKGRPAGDTILMGSAACTSLSDPKYGLVGEQTFAGDIFALSSLRHSLSDADSAAHSLTSVEKTHNWWQSLTDEQLRQLEQTQSPLSFAVSGAGKTGPLSSVSFLPTAVPSPDCDVRDVPGPPASLSLAATGMGHSNSVLGTHAVHLGGSGSNAQQQQEQSRQHREPESHRGRVPTPAPLQKKFAEKGRDTEESGGEDDYRKPKIPGVRYDQAGHRWVASWSVNSRQIAKYFPVNKFGNKRARELAVLARLDATKQVGITTKENRKRLASQARHFDHHGDHQAQQGVYTDSWVDQPGPAPAPCIGWKEASVSPSAPSSCACPSCSSLSTPAQKPLGGMENAANLTGCSQPGSGGTLPAVPHPETASPLLPSPCCFPASRFSSASCQFGPGSGRGPSPRQCATGEALSSLSPLPFSAGPAFPDPCRSAQHGLRCRPRNTPQPGNDSPQPGLRRPRKGHLSLTFSQTRRVSPEEQRLRRNPVSPGVPLGDTADSGRGRKTDEFFFPTVCKKSAIATASVEAPHCLEGVKLCVAERSSARGKNGQSPDASQLRSADNPSGPDQGIDREKLYAGVTGAAFSNQVWPV